MAATTFALGIGVPADAALAAALNERTCRIMPGSCACRDAGLSYRDGVGVPADRAKADALLAAAGISDENYCRMMDDFILQYGLFSPGAVI